MQLSGSQEEQPGQNFVFACRQRAQAEISGHIFQDGDLLAAHIEVADVIGRLVQQLIIEFGIDNLPVFFQLIIQLIQQPLLIAVISLTKSDAETVQHFLHLRLDLFAKQDDLARFGWHIEIEQNRHAGSDHHQG